MAEYKTDAQVNYGWGLSLEMTGKAPAIAKRIFATKADAQAYVNDANDSAIAGLQLSVINDSVDANNGIYFVAKAGTSSEAGVLVKVGSDSEAELGALQGQVSSLEGQIANKADEFTVGEGLTYEDNKIELVIDPESAEILSVSEDGLKIDIPEVEVPEYTLAVSATTTDGAIKSYELQKDGKQVGVKIDIPKDLVVSSGSVVKGSAESGQGLVADDLYLKLIIGNSNTPVYIAVKDLTDVYTAGAYLSLDGGQFSVNYTSLKAEILKDVASEITDDLESQLDDLSVQVGQNTSGLETATGKIGAIEEKLGEGGEIGQAIDSLETSLAEIKVKDVDTTTVSGIALALDSNGRVKIGSVSAQTLAAAIQDHLDIKTDGTEIVVGADVKGGESAGTIASASDSIADALNKLAVKIETAASGGVTSINGDDYIKATGSGTSRSLSLEVSAVAAAIVNENSSIAEENGKLDLVWIELE